MGEGGGIFKKGIWGKNKYYMGPWGIIFRRIFIHGRGGRIFINI